MNTLFWRDFYWCWYLFWFYFHIHLLNGGHNFQEKSLNFPTKIYSIQSTEHLPQNWSVCVDFTINLVFLKNTSSNRIFGYQNLEKKWFVRCLNLGQIWLKNALKWYGMSNRKWFNNGFLLLFNQVHRIW